MSGNGEPMATEEPADASPSSTRITFENVRIQLLSEDGGAEDKYPGDNNKIRVEYDPEVSAFRTEHGPLPLKPVVSAAGHAGPPPGSKR